MLNIRRSLRSLASRPVFPAVAVATLALGLGVNAAIFSLTREVLLRPLPYRDADRLVRVFEVSRALGVASAPIAPVNYIAWRDLVDAFEQTAVFRRVAFNVSRERARCRWRDSRSHPHSFQCSASNRPSAAGSPTRTPSRVAMQSSC